MNSSQPARPKSATVDPRFDEFSPLRRVAVCPPAASYQSQANIDASWQDQLFLDRPDFAAAQAEFSALAQAMHGAGAEVECLSPAPEFGLSAIYARDNATVSPRGLIILKPANASRVAEADAVARAYADMGVPIAGRITGEGTVEGGDIVWFDETTCAVAHGCRTNAEGIRQLRAILGEEVELLVVGVPYWEGPATCLHLMSFISPLDHDLAAIYPRLLPVPFRDWLIARGMRFVEVPDEEYEPSLGSNILATAPRQAITIDGNPVTKARLEAAGCKVTAVTGTHIAVFGGGGPTCLTRPLLRGG